MQHGHSLDENNQNVIKASENENRNKKIIKPDIASSQNKLYKIQKIQLLDKTTKTIKIQAIPKHDEFFSRIKHLIQRHKIKIKIPEFVLLQPKINLGFYSWKYQGYKMIGNIQPLQKDYEYNLNYNSENNLLL